jgi:hypothetical protein
MKEKIAEGYTEGSKPRDSSDEYRCIDYASRLFSSMAQP